jgi:hypothetical protein
MKIVVFDLDETMGYFVEFGIFIDCLKIYLNDITQTQFNDILDLFPEFLRPNIMNILNYLKQKKNARSCDKLMIYTNNQKDWATKIISYFETKINYKLFDHLISAFKVNGKDVDMCRTSQNKSYADFIRCTKLPPNAKICFLDNHLYQDMVHDNIYYINLKCYTYALDFNSMIARFKESEVGKKLIGVHESKFVNFMNNEYKKYNYKYIEKDQDEFEVDKIIGKQIMTHLHLFFNSNKTRRHTKRKKNKTLRRGYD